MLKIKVDLFNVFAHLKAMVENKIDKSIKCLRTNNGDEFTSL